MNSLLTLVALTASAVAPGPAQAQEGSFHRLCFSRAETRENVAVHRLREPLAVLQQAAREIRAEPLGSRLCRTRDQFVYEMSLLRRDGRVVRVVVDAASGARLSVREARER